MIGFFKLVVCCTIATLLQSRLIFTLITYYLFILCTSLCTHFVFCDYLKLPIRNYILICSYNNWFLWLLLQYKTASEFKLLNYLTSFLPYSKHFVWVYDYIIHNQYWNKLLYTNFNICEHYMSKYKFTNSRLTHATACTLY